MKLTFLHLKQVLNFFAHQQNDGLFQETEHLNVTFLNLSEHILSKQKEYASNLLKYQNHVRDQCLLSHVVPSENVSNYLTDIA